MAVSTFCRLYAHSVGPEYRATPEYVANVLASMQQAATSDVPFSVKLRMDDGSSVIVRPKGRA